MKQKVIITKGLPASGKTTWAKKWVESHQGHWKRINKDDLRAMLDAGIWSKANEKTILLLRDHIMDTLLVGGYSVIIDDTNLHPKHEEQIRGEVMELMGKDVKVEVKDFTNVSLEECIKRDQKRSNPVGERKIKEMYKNFLKPKIEPVKYDPNLPLCIVCDLDGTLCLFDGNPYERDFTQDRVNKPIADIVNLYAENGMRIFYVSGRKEKFRNQTELWLKKHDLDWALPLMRKDNDERKDAIVKKEIYEEFIKGKYNVQFVLDDRNQMVEMWRELGITCLQVAEGDF